MNELHVDKDSEIDLSGINDLDEFLTHAKITADDGAILWAPDNATFEEVIEGLVEIFGKGKVPAITVYSWNDDESDWIEWGPEEIQKAANPSAPSSGGCDAGFGFAGLVLMAGAALIRRGKK